MAHCTLPACLLAHGRGRGAARPQVSLSAPAQLVVCAGQPAQPIARLTTAVLCLLDCLQRHAERSRALGATCPCVEHARSGHSVQWPRPACRRCGEYRWRCRQRRHCRVDRQRHHLGPGTGAVGYRCVEERQHPYNQSCRRPCPSGQCGVWLELDEKLVLEPLQMPWYEVLQHLLGRADSRKLLSAMWRHWHR